MQVQPHLEVAISDTEPSGLSIALQELGFRAAEVQCYGARDSWPRAEVVITRASQTLVA